MKEDLIKTHNGRVIRKDDVQFTFSVLKALYKSKGVKLTTSMYGGINTKASCINKVFQLISEANGLDSLEFMLEMEQECENALEEGRQMERVKLCRHFLIASGILFGIGLIVGQFI